MTAPVNGAARQIWVSIAGLGFTVAAALVTAILWIGAISSDVKSNKDDLVSVHRDQSETHAEVRQIQIDLTKLQTSQIETETQFCASDIVRNLMHANDLREIAMLHNAVFHTTYPTDNSYYPQICRRDTGAK